MILYMVSLFCFFRCTIKVLLLNGASPLKLNRSYSYWLHKFFFDFIEVLNYLFGLSKIPVGVIELAPVIRLIRPSTPAEPDAAVPSNPGSLIVEL